MRAASGYNDHPRDSQRRPWLPRARLVCAASNHTITPDGVIAPRGTRSRRTGHADDRFPISPARCARSQRRRRRCPRRSALTIATPRMRSRGAHSPGRAQWQRRDDGLRGASLHSPRIRIDPSSGQGAGGGDSRPRGVFGLRPSPAIGIGGWAGRGCRTNIKCPFLNGTGRRPLVGNRVSGWGSAEQRDRERAKDKPNVAAGTFAHDRCPLRSSPLLEGKKCPICRHFESGSDGTRTRDLRRDRPAL